MQLASLSSVLLLAAATVAATACARDSRPATQAPEPPVAGSPETAPPSGHASAMAPQPGAGEAGPAFLVDPGAPAARRVDTVVAVLAPTAGNRTAGTVRFRETTRGLEVVTDVKQLPGGTHAYHVHVFGDCSAPDAASAGPHFHFSGSAFDKHVPFITGNLGELDGKQATHRATIEGASIHGPYSIIGRAVVVHEQGNDPEVTPDGGAGKRIACGVIGIAQVPEEQRAQR